MSTDLAPDLRTALDSALEPSAAELLALHDRLVQRAEAAALLDVAYTTVETPVGALLLVATDRGVVRVAFERQDHDLALREVAAATSPRVLRSPVRLAAVSDQVRRYFDGTLHRFDVPVDLRLAQGFRAQVLRHLVDIGYGRTETYADVARATGSPRAVRAVGTACARNPVPLVVPCHRVVRSDGSPGQYAGGAETKRLLLQLESGAA